MPAKKEAVKKETEKKTVKKAVAKTVASAVETGAKAAAKTAAKAVKAAPAKKTAPAKKAAPTKKAAKKPEVIIQSPMGGIITPEEILKRVGKVDKVYVRVDQNKAHWVRGDEIGSIDLWD
ncbi:hypothetical protein [Aristaeella lactis]|uniref:Ribosome biogenesis protein UTP30 n=1 Tax=Aristaeella lactis TaxID=3046383 RepID=A0AC61PMY0_9FIRM|nr:hypothetical protein [Aristaeella lactis]QUA52744.1 hypothetical protein JYE50_13785 [Aristaeella lactis]SMC72824.1 ribosome biogenesis protein UTP30 [Aristaeella lactis]